MGGFNTGSGRGGSGGGSGPNNSPGTTQSGGNVGGSSNKDGPRTDTPKKSIATKIKDSASAMLTARKRAAYGVASLIPGMEKGLIKNRTDYKEYLKPRGNNPDFLNTDDKTLASFDTFEQIRTYQPTGGALNYADYLAERKGNYNLQQAGDVGGMNNKGGNKKPEGIEISNELSKNSILSTAETQKTAANNVKGPTTTEMTAAETNVANKRKGRKSTNITGAIGLANDYTLSKKTLLG